MTTLVLFPVLGIVMGIAGILGMLAIIVAAVILDSERSSSASPSKPGPGSDSPPSTDGKTPRRNRDMWNDPPAGFRH